MTMIKSRRATAKTPTIAARLATAKTWRDFRQAVFGHTDAQFLEDLRTFFSNKKEEIRVSVVLDADRTGSAGAVYSMAWHRTLMKELVCTADRFETIAAAIVALGKQIEAAAAAQEEQAKASPLPYQGVWVQGRQYLPGQFLTYQGSLWHCDKKTLARPGDDPAAYTLAVKRGQDGKDVRA